MGSFGHQAGGDQAHERENPGESWAHPASPYHPRFDVLENSSAHEKRLDIGHGFF